MSVSYILQPWELVFVVLASWVSREQQEAIDYLRTENAVLKEKLGKKRIILTDNQRRRLAVKGKILGRYQRLEEAGTWFTPDTILRWHRKLVAQKWDYSDRRKSVGRPRLEKDVIELVLRLAVTTYPDYYHRARNHQGLGNTIIDPNEKIGRPDGEVKCRGRLGGLLNYLLSIGCMTQERFQYSVRARYLKKERTVERKGKRFEPAPNNVGSIPCVPFKYKARTANNLHISRVF